MLRKPIKIVNIVIEDYIIRFIESIGNSIKSIRIIKEKPLPKGIIVGGKIQDEIQFFEFMRDLVKECGIKNRHVRFYVPSALVIMRQVEFPANLQGKEIKEHFQFEIGKSIHLPFKDPVFDIHYRNENTDVEKTNKEEMRLATMFAAPEDEVRKYADIFDDVKLKPILADVQAIGIYRYFQHVTKVNVNKAFLFVEMNIDSINISIFNHHQLEFMRFQNLDLTIKGSTIDNEKSGHNQWIYEQDENVVMTIVDDQIIELERIMNFYTFSVKKGEQQEYEIVLLGDHSYLKSFYEKVNERFNIPVTLLKGIVSQDNEVDSKYIPALGLALKGGTDDAS